MDRVEIRFNSFDPSMLELDSVKFSYDGIKRFGIFLANMSGADELVMHEVGEDGEFVAVIDCSHDEEIEKLCS